MIAAVVVTRDSGRWIEATLASILGQVRVPDVVVVVDDGSTDGTRNVVVRVLGDRARVEGSTATSTDPKTRIAHNFRQGLQACSDCEIAVLGDHDDLWKPERVSHQAAVLESAPTAVMVGSDGRLVDASGVPIGGTLRDAFPLGMEWSTANATARMRATLRRSIATGGASAVRPTAFANHEIPPGWLHDRWWSLVATAEERMLVDDTIVIDYRVTESQAVGLGRGDQGLTPVGRLFAGAGRLGETLARMGDLRSLAGDATEATRPELQGARLLRNLL